MLLELWQHGAEPLLSGALEPFPNPKPDPSPRQLHAISSCSATVTSEQSSALPLHSPLVFIVCVWNKYVSLSPNHMLRAALGVSVSSHKTTNLSMHEVFHLKTVFSVWSGCNYSVR